MGPGDETILEWNKISPKNWTIRVKKFSAVVITALPALYYYRILSPLIYYEISSFSSCNKVLGGLIFNMPYRISPKPFPTAGQSSDSIALLTPAYPIDITWKLPKNPSYTYFA